MNTNKLLVGVLVLQSLALLGQWTGGPSIPAAHAQAQVPESLNRSGLMLEEMRSMNAKFDKLLCLLEGGKLQVQMAEEKPRK